VLRAFQKPKVYIPPVYFFYTIHAEIHVYEAILGEDWTDKDTYEEFYGDAHTYAVIQELRFLAEWARQEGFDLPEMAIEAEHPARSTYEGHEPFLERLSQRTGWTLPTPGQRRAARRFWGKILKRP
jgi:hypothetical protein